MKKTNDSILLIDALRSLKQKKLPNGLESVLAVAELRGKRRLTLFDPFTGIRFAGSRARFGWLFWRQRAETAEKRPEGCPLTPKKTINRFLKLTPGVELGFPKV